MWAELGIGAVLVVVGGLVGFWIGTKRDDKQHMRQLEQAACKEWNDATKPIRIKVIAARLNDAYEPIELEDYSEVAELIEARIDEQTAAQLVMECRGYNDCTKNHATLSDPYRASTTEFTTLSGDSDRPIVDVTIQRYAERLKDYVKPITLS